MQGRLNNACAYWIENVDSMMSTHSFIQSLSVKSTFNVFFFIPSSLVAEELARLHTLPVPNTWLPGQTRPNFFLQFYKMLELLPSAFSDPAQDKRLESMF